MDNKDRSIIYSLQLLQLMKYCKKSQVETTLNGKELKSIALTIVLAEGIS